MPGKREGEGGAGKEREEGERPEREARRVIDEGQKE